MARAVRKSSAFARVLRCREAARPGGRRRSDRRRVHGATRHAFRGGRHRLEARRAHVGGIDRRGKGRMKRPFLFLGMKCHLSHSPVYACGIFCRRAFVRIWSALVASIRMACLAVAGVYPRMDTRQQVRISMLTAFVFSPNLLWCKVFSIMNPVRAVSISGIDKTPGQDGV